MGVLKVHSQNESNLTLLSSAARTSTGQGTAVTALGAYKSATVFLDVTVAATDAADTLDVYVEYSPDGGTVWDNLVHFTQALGNGGAMLSGAVKQQLKDAFPYALLNDSYGASETGASGSEVGSGATNDRPTFTSDGKTSARRRARGPTARSRRWRRRVDSGLGSCWSAETRSSRTSMNGA